MASKRYGLHLYAYFFRVNFARYILCMNLRCKVYGIARISHQIHQRSTQQKTSTWIFALPNDYTVYPVNHIDYLAFAMIGLAKVSYTSTLGDFSATVDV